MFYSHSFLARKSPLGTVWIAAHLQHRLRKNQVSITSIPTTVDYIMLSEVPMALRTSAHLLLGVVRIYSKKVEYLYHDCNDVLTRMRTLFASVNDINLPEGATCAPFHSITLPETYELDALDLDMEIVPYNDNVADNHVSTSEDITMIDHIPSEADPFFLIEDIRMDVLPMEEIPDTGLLPMDEDLPTNQIDSSGSDNVPEDQSEPLTIPTSHFDGGEPLSDHVPIDQPAEFNQDLPEVHFHEALPETEIMRDAVHNFGSDNLDGLLGIRNDVTEPQGPLHPNSNDKFHPSPILEDLVESGRLSLPPPHTDPSSVVPPVTPVNANMSTSQGFGSGNASLELVIQPTPPVQKQKVNRKRKQFFDTTVVLTNQFIKEGLDNTSSIVRKRKKLPCSALDVWRFTKRSKIDQVFIDSSISGMCEELQNLCRKVFPVESSETVPGESGETVPVESSETVPIEDTHLEAGGTVSVEDTHFEAGGTVPVEDTHFEAGGTVPVEDTQLEATEIIPVGETNLEVGPTVPANESLMEARGASSPVPMSEYDTEIERLRHVEDQGYGSAFTDFVPSSSHGDEFTPFPASNMSSEPPTGTTLGTDPLLTVERTASTEAFNSDMETPMTRFEQQLGIEGSGLSDIPEMVNSAEEEGLSFLDADSTRSAGQSENELQTLSVRTRAVAQYLKDQSPATVVSKEQSRELSLNRILEGKTRKKCARMFFETLVLKSYGLVDVRQEEPYGDVSLLLDPLSTAQF